MFTARYELGRLIYIEFFFFFCFMNVNLKKMSGLSELNFCFKYIREAQPPKSNSRFRYHSGKKLQSNAFQIHSRTKHIYICFYIEREKERECVVTVSENLTGKGRILAPNWIQVRIVTCNNVTIMVQYGAVYSIVRAYGQHATYFDLKI